VSPVATGRAWDEQWANLATILTAALGLPGLFFIWRTLTATKKGATAERTTHLLERMNNRRILGSWSDVLTVINVDEGRAVDVVRRTIAVPSGNDPLLGELFDLPAPFPRAAWPDPAGSEVSLNDVAALINFYEEVALLYNKRQIDRRLLELGFGDQIVLAFCMHWWWIEYRRAGLPAAASPRRARSHETETLAQWERMVRRILRRRPDFLRERSGPVRVLCRPVAGATAAEWDRCARLSSAAGRVLRSGGAGSLWSALDASPKSAAEPGGPPTTICLPAWSDIRPQPRAGARATRRAGAWLDGLWRRKKTRRRWIHRVGLRLERVDPQAEVFARYDALAMALDRRRGEADDADELERLIEELGAAAERAENPATSEAH
jgi:hypothetical protein